MLTDLHLLKYLEGRLSIKESEELEKLLAQNPDLQTKLEALKNQSQVLGNTGRQRRLMERGTRRGSRTRYTTLLPALLLLMVVLMVTRHWFSRPGENSTFTLHGGNGTGIEVLYNSSKGWRYLDASFKPGDSLTFSIRDTSSYHLKILALFGKGPDTEVLTLMEADSIKRFHKTSPKPAFTLNSPARVMVLYAENPLPPLDRIAILDLLESQGNERGGLDFKYQIFSAGQ